MIQDAYPESSQIALEGMESANDKAVPLRRMGRIVPITTQFGKTVLIFHELVVTVKSCDYMLFC